MATLKNHPGFWLRDDAAAAFDRAEADHGKFKVNSAARTAGQQQELINRYDKGGVYNRPPYLYPPARPAASSNHVRNGGVAIDLADWRRFAAICTRYGFKHTNPGGDPVHFDYVGGGSVPANSTPATKVVRDRQNFLNAARGEQLVVDGKAGAKTKAAIKRYQTFLRGYGYTAAVDGVWGAGTQKAHAKYYAVWSSPKPAIGPLLKVGSKGAEVARLQKHLNKHYPAYSKLATDGIFGAGTKKVVVEFQRRSKLVPDGVVGPATRRAMGF